METETMMSMYVLFVLGDVGWKGQSQQMKLSDGKMPRTLKFFPLEYVTLLI